MDIIIISILLRTISSTAVRFDETVVSIGFYLVEILLLYCFCEKGRLNYSMY